MCNQLIQEQEDVRTVEQEKRDHWFIVRARRIWMKGYKDGCCHLYNVEDVPAKFRHHYNAGHTTSLHDSGQVSPPDRREGRDDRMARVSPVDSSAVHHLAMEYVL